MFLTRPPRDRPKAAPFDLHALGTPPALILSQDQTLHHDLSCPASPTRISRSRPPPPRSFVRFWLWSPIRARAPEGPAAPHRLHSVFRAHPAHPRLRSLPCSGDYRLICETRSPKLPILSATFLIEAPTAVAWNSTAVNRCSGAQPRAASRPRRPTDSTAPAGDRQGFPTVNVPVHPGTGVRRHEFG